MYSEYLELATRTARLAGELLNEGFGTIFKISNKEGKNNLVTEYDIKAEELIIGEIKKAYPDHTFLAEESGKSDGLESDYRWIIDPLDGTVNFSHNLPIFSVSIALEFKGDIICGCVYHPVLDEMFSAELGKGAFLNGEKISVSENDDFSRAYLVTGFPYNVNENPANCINHFEKMLKMGLPIRRLGSAALDLCYVACGRFDGFWEVVLHPWDVAAGKIIVEEAGGRMSHYDGSPYQVSTSSMIATNNKIHNALVQIISED